MSDLARSFDGVKLEEHEAKYSLTRNHENEPSTKSGDIRDRLGEPVSKYEDHRSGRDSRDRERHRSRDRNRERGRSDRDRDRDRRDRRERDRSRPRHRDERSYGSEVKKEEGGRPPRETRGRRESPGQQPLRARSRSITPLHKKKA
ncbi:hypothetical protein DSO57_1033651 [Entomophthora muscae]|uniref:Uncharacterized protein n=1 Tax=Entomophthora muscae TaxID=34485 RepID=A0ACC2S258_9FUNG|nr:hypothetical protein DSO57_1033651 [Entomophthora muscae]